MHNIHNITLTCLRQDHSGEITPKSSFDDWFTRYGQYEVSIFGPANLEAIWEIAFACGEALGKRSYNDGYDEGHTDGYREGRSDAEGS